MQDPPAELLEEILDVLAVPLGVPTEQLPDRATLLSCSLVSQRWSRHSQRLLFRRVVIGDVWVWNMSNDSQPSVNLASFFQTITADTDKARWLRDNNLCLVLRPLAAAKPTDILALLANLPSLRELDITAEACAFTDEELSGLRNSGLSIRSLRVNANYVGLVRPMPMLTPGWPAVIRFLEIIPTLRILDITANTFQEFPPMPELQPPLGLGLISFKLQSRWLINGAPLLAFLVGNRTDNERLEVFHRTQSATPVDLQDVLSAHGPQLRYLVVPESLGNPNVLRLCTRLECFECETLPHQGVVAAIPRTITALAITNPPTQRFSLNRLYDGRVVERRVAYLTEQLHTFPALRILTWAGSSAHSGLAALCDRCNELGIAVRFRPSNTIGLRDDELEFALRSSLA
ncbi:hypothetical protein MSAN_00869800 [Mycena sanguinolenta]|uniref:F-box domain-containing protein n=1 Tax=Mycena sanguinolenta TaxID=230812 RepID=A0A8H6YZA4_9AGAR|nr:hypothetical protein MSAN_00869800 [Mycena sanguinolenta]